MKKFANNLPYTKYESGGKIFKTLKKNNLSEFHTISQNSSNYEAEKLYIKNLFKGIYYHCIALFEKQKVTYELLIDWNFTILK